MTVTTTLDQATYTPSNSIAQELIDYQDQQQAKQMHQAYLDAQPKPTVLEVIQLKKQAEDGLCAWKNPAYGAIEPIVREPQTRSSKVGHHYQSSMPVVTAH